MRNLSVICVLFLSFKTIKLLPIKVDVVDDPVYMPQENILTNENFYEDDPSEPSEETVMVSDEIASVKYSNIIGDVTALDTEVQSSIRPGMIVNSYAVELEPLAGRLFNGRVRIQVTITDVSTLEDPILFQVSNLRIHAVSFSVAGGSTFIPTRFEVNDEDGTLQIFTTFPASLYTFIVQYNGFTDMLGSGFYRGSLINGEYIAMNLHPTNARRVFPCMDEPNLLSITSFTFTGMQFTTMISNSQLDVDSTTTFRSLQGPVHLWAMVAHSMNNINIPVANTVFLYARQGIMNQDAQANVAINNYYNKLNEWTEKPHADFIQNQNGGLHITAVPDISRDWYGLSTLCIWEPYIMMENNNAVKQRKTALVTIAEGMARQWFGYLIFPENWRYQWVVAGIGSYAAYEIVKEFQTPVQVEDDTLIDMNTIFTTDVIQESLLYDAYSSARPLEAADNIFGEDEIRLNIYGLVKTKAPALLRMAKLVLGEERDIVQAGARALLTSRALQEVNSRNFYDALNSEYSFGIGGSGLINAVDEFLRPWVINSGYPLIHVGLRVGGVLVTQKRFGFSVRPQLNYLIPLTFTTSLNPNFDNIYPDMMMETTMPLNFALGEEDWVVFNIQGQGYFRVNYDGELWERLIMALSDPETRNDIHPLNRACLVDDALNLARAGEIGYDIAFSIVLTMEHETDYAVWKAFVRNMDFIRKRLVALVEMDEERDPDIYLRMVRRTIEAVEEEIGFIPESAVEPSMESLTRGLVMDHACRAGYDPCIAAAVDLFFDPNNDEAVNPNIPPEIRPAVYCTMVREGEEDAITALEERLLIEQSRYERLVILESLACSNDAVFISRLLDNTIAGNSPYVVEERSKIFAAVASSSFENAGRALNFLIGRTAAIRDAYGGPEKLEEAIFVMAENIADPGQTNDFVRWVTSLNIISNLDDSNLAAESARSRVDENLIWLNERMQGAYEWIDENDAPTVFASTFILILSLVVTMINILKNYF